VAALPRRPGAAVRARAALSRRQDRRRGGHDRRGPRDRDRGRRRRRLNSTPMVGDRERWNARWREQAGELAPPAAFVVEHTALLPASGRALDVAGGAGRHAVWLARAGLDVTMIDVSDVA